MVTEFLMFPGAIPYCGYDGSGLRHDRRDPAVLHGIRSGTQSGTEDRSDVPTVLGAAVLPAPLRLRYAGGQVGTDRCREPQAAISRARRGRTATEVH